MGARIRIVVYFAVCGYRAEVLRGKAVLHTTDRYETREDAYAHARRWQEDYTLAAGILPGLKL